MSRIFKDLSPTDEAMPKLIVNERGLHRSWGLKKLEDTLLKKHGVERPLTGLILQVMG